ncbi:BatA and WFA domain-containing protein [Rhodopirellula sp.]|nr:BatA and WFA domain-containing protein [Rhodopirellula sp.]
MNLIPALSNPLAWALLGLIPVGIILLYFLKLKREPVEVPSTYLWAKTIEDLHVNSLLQRLRRSLLLFLQLLAVIIAAIALLRPGFQGETSGQQRTVFLLDNSASMQAVDRNATVSRFDNAKLLIGERIETMSDTDLAMLITFNDRPETVQAFTTDRARLRDALKRVKITNRSTDILGALKAADGLANPRRSSEIADVNDVQVADAQPADLLIFSDGGFQTVTDFSLGNLTAEYIAMGSSAVRNLAITAFSTERNTERPAEVQAFATIENFSSETITTSATLRMNGQFLDAEAIEIDAGDQTGLSFILETQEAATLSLSLDLEDDLKIDNTAYTGLSPLRNVSIVVITPGNTPLKVGLETDKTKKICTTSFFSPSYLKTDDYKQRAASGKDDLIIYDTCSPAEMPATNTFFIGALPPPTSTIETEIPEPVTESDSPTGAGANVDETGNVAANPDVVNPDDGSVASFADQNWRWASPMSSVNLIDIERTHPLMRYLELYSLLIFSGRGVEGPPGTIELVGADVGSILSIAPREGFQDMVLGFEIISRNGEGVVETNTNWYAERSWPVFLLNVLRYLAGAADASGAPSYRPGETVRIRLENAITAPTVTRIGGSPVDLTPGPAGALEIIETEVPGNYRVESEAKLADLFAINLFDPRESSIATVNEIELGYESVSSQDNGIVQRKEFWRWALIAMLGLIATEWWVYSRRVA